jgi:hypothetical protein
VNKGEGTLSALTLHQGFIAAHHYESVGQLSHRVAQGNLDRKGEGVSEDKPEGATHLQNEKPPDSEIEAEELLEVAAGALSALGSVPDPTDQILLSPNHTSGWPRVAPAGVTIQTEEGWHDPNVAWLRNPKSFASAHFCIRRDGKIVQLVWERDRAWHARTSGMHYFGIEHEGDQASDPYLSFGRRAVTRMTCATTIIC